jgi:hypothetical protein
MRIRKLWMLIATVMALLAASALLVWLKSGHASIFVHEDEWNSMRFFTFDGPGDPCAPVSPRARLPSDFTKPYGGCDHGGQASFETETQNQSLYREGAGCRRIEFFAGG